MHDLDQSDLVFEADDFEPGARRQGSYGEVSAYDGEAAESSPGFDEREQAELASELLSVSDDGELDQFLGGLLKRVTRKIGKVLPKPLLDNLGGLLKGAVKKVVPAIAGAVGGPVGMALASQAAPALGSLLGLELEGLSAEDQEFEAARQFVRLAEEAAKQAATATQQEQPHLAARNAMIQASRRYAPGLVAPRSRAPSQRGTWYRQGNRIVLVGV
jgi:hypothetical protein